MSDFNEFPRSSGNEILTVILCGPNFSGNKIAKNCFILNIRAKLIHFRLKNKIWKKSIGLDLHKTLKSILKFFRMVERSSENGSDFLAMECICFISNDSFQEEQQQEMDQQDHCPKETEERCDEIREKVVIHGVFSENYYAITKDPGSLLNENQVVDENIYSIAENPWLLFEKSRVQLLRRLGCDKLPLFIKWLLEFYVVVENFQVPSITFIQKSLGDDSVMTVDSSLSTIRLLTLNFGGHVPGNTYNIGWIPYLNPTKRNSNGCFGLQDEGSIKLVFPSIEELISWTTACPQFAIEYPVSVKGFPLLASNGMNKKIQFYADTQYSLQNFLRVGLIQFVCFKGLRVERLGPKFIRDNNDVPKHEVQLYTVKNMRLQSGELNYI